MDLDRFQFHLYVSFPNRADSVGLELLQAFSEYCVRNKLPFFKLHLRLSQERMNAGRWDEDFIRAEIGRTPVDQIRRVWVCGPPIMNQTFDRVLSANDGTSLGLSRTQYEIL